MSSAFNKNLKIITAFLPAGKGFELLEYLHESGYTTANVSNARGSFIAGALDKTGEPLEEQKEILTCMVEKDKADELFENLYDMAGFDKPGTGFMFIENLFFGSTYALPEMGSA